MKPIWITTTAILIIVSAYFSVTLFTELAADPITATVYAAAIIALTLTQYASLSRGMGQWRQGQITGATVSLTTWALLTALSIGASAAALIGDTQRQQQTAVTNGTEYQLILGQIQQLQQQSEQLQTTAQIDTESGYRSRAVKTLDKNTAIQNNITELRQKLSQLPPEQTTSATALFTRIAEHTGHTADTVMTAVYMAVAVLIELALTVSVTALTESPVTKSDHKLVQSTKQQQKHQPAPAEPATLLVRFNQWLLGGRPVTYA